MASTLPVALRDQPNELLERWLMRFEHSRIRFQRKLSGHAYVAQAAALLDALAIAAQGDLTPGTDATRELERACALLGAQLSGTSASGFDVAAMLLALRDAVAEVVDGELAERVDALFEWVTIVAMDAFAAAGLQSLRERTIEELEAGTPVVELLPKVPAVLFVGGPTATTMATLLSRALMLCIGAGSTALILDVTGLAELALAQFPKVFSAFLTDDAPASIELVLVGAPRRVATACAETANELARRLHVVDRLDSAIEHTLRRGGYAVVSSR